MKRVTFSRLLGGVWAILGFIALLSEKYFEAIAILAVAIFLLA